MCLAGGPVAVSAASENKPKLFVGVQVRKQSFDQRGIGLVIDDLVKTVSMNAVISINVAKAEDIQAVAEAAAQRGVRYFPAKFRTLVMPDNSLGFFGAEGS
jgi:hypothetical protein